MRARRDFRVATLVGSSAAMLAIACATVPSSESASSLEQAITTTATTAPPLRPTQIRCPVKPGHAFDYCIYRNNCHTAAYTCMLLNKKTPVGIGHCSPKLSQTGFGGHTFNWYWNGNGEACLVEPMNGQECCAKPTNAVSKPPKPGDVPDLLNGPLAACTHAMCDDPDAGTGVNGSTASAVGHCDVPFVGSASCAVKYFPSDATKQKKACAQKSGADVAAMLKACNKCCTDQVKTWTNGGVGGTQADKDAFLKECGNACNATKQQYCATECPLTLPAPTPKPKPGTATTSSSGGEAPPDEDDTVIYDTFDDEDIVLDEPNAEPIGDIVDAELAPSAGEPLPTATAL